MSSATSGSVSGNALSTARLREPLSHRRLTGVFIGMGGTAAVIPALLPALAAQYGVELDAVLPAVPALFSGLVVGIVAGGWWGRRADRATLLSIASAAQAAGLMIIALSAAPAGLLLGAAMSGAGFGLAEVIGAASARQLAPAGSPRLLTRLMAALAASAMAAPVVVLMATESGWPGAAAGVIAATHLLAVRPPRRGANLPVQVESATVFDDPARDTPARLAPTGTLVLLAAGVFFYVGAETILSGWSAAAVVAATGAGAGVAALGTSVFWLLMVAGRVLGARILARPRATLPLLIVASLLLWGSLLGAAVLAPEGGLPVLALLAVAVLAAAPCYGILVGLVVDHVDADHAAPTASAVITVGAVGGAVVPAIASLAGVTMTYAVAAIAAAGVTTLTIAFAIRERHAVDRKEPRR